jgi:hypothetical protein
MAVNPGKDAAPESPAGCRGVLLCCVTLMPELHRRAFQAVGTKVPYRGRRADRRSSPSSTWENPANAARDYFASLPRRTAAQGGIRRALLMNAYRAMQVPGVPGFGYHERGLTRSELAPPTTGSLAARKTGAFTRGGCYPRSSSSSIISRIRLQCSCSRRSPSR